MPMDLQNSLDLVQILHEINSELILIKEKLSDRKTPEKPIGIDDASKIVLLSPSHIYKLTSTRRIPFHRRPGTKKLYFFESELTDWFKTNPPKALLKRKPRG